MRGIHFLFTLIFGATMGDSVPAGAETAADAPKQKAKPEKEVAGKADVLRHVKKHFATFGGMKKTGEVQLHIEGQDGESTWPVMPDAQFKVDGWWGRPEQFTAGDRVWVWLAVNRDKKPVAVLMLADEVSEQDIHGEPLVVKSIDGGAVTLHIPNQKKVLARTLQKNGHELKVGDKGLVQTAGGSITRWMSAEEFEKKRTAQQDWLRERWRGEGLPGMIAFLHPIGGEMEIFLDHEGIRWGRHLEIGSEVSFEDGARVIEARVKMVEPWREKTRLRLVTKSGMDQLDLKPGQRIGLKVPEPSAEIQASDLPTDLGRFEAREDRVNWFLSTIYCSCGIAGDRCTGMFYTLASCNVNACGAPNEMRSVIGEFIDKGHSDGEIFERLRNDRGRDVWRPHLLR